MKQTIKERRLGEWKKNLPTFWDAAKRYFDGDLPRKDFKGISGGFGCYAQRADDKVMLRLRMTAGRVPKDVFAFFAGILKKYPGVGAHFTTCQSIQLHNLDYEKLVAIQKAAYDHGIITMGGGGDNPRNVMCSPLSGIDKDEYFNVLPYAEAAADYALSFIGSPKKLPRKYKIVFSNSPRNESHATFHDLGFVARSDHKFDVYASGGLGPNAAMGLLMEEAVSPKDILYYVYAQWKTFQENGNFENRGRARSRYLPVTMGVEGYKKEFFKNLEEIRAKEDLTLSLRTSASRKKGDGGTVEDPRVIPQKQEGLYSVKWHTAGGWPKNEDFIAVSNAIKPMRGVELRLGSYETAYIVNLTSSEAKEILAVTERSAAKTPFECSVSCVGGTICQQGIRDSHGVLEASIKAVKEANLPADALPLCHFSGCPSSCGTHQVGVIGFRGSTKNKQSAFALFLGGCKEQGHEIFSDEVGTMYDRDVPKFLVTLGKTVAKSGKSFEEWKKVHEGEIEKIARPFLDAE